MADTPNLTLLSIDEIRKYMKQFNVTYEVAIFEMHQLIDKYKEHLAYENKLANMFECVVADYKERSNTYV